MTTDRAPNAEDRALRDLEWVRCLARQLLKDASLVDDVVQDAWLAARQRAPGTWRHGPRAWLAAVVRNRVHRLARAAERRRRRELECAPAATQESAADVVARGAMYRELVDAVMQLDEPYRSAILWRYLDELSAIEVAARQGVSHDAARQRISRGLQMLRERLGDRYRGGFVAWCSLWLPHLGLGAPATLSLMSMLLPATLLALLVLAAGAFAVWWPQTGMPAAVVAATGNGPVERAPSGVSDPRPEAAGERTRVGRDDALRCRLADAVGAPAALVSAFALHDGRLIARTISDDAGVVEFAAGTHLDEVLFAAAATVPLRVVVSGAMPQNATFPVGDVVGGVAEKPPDSEPCQLVLEHDRPGAWSEGLDPAVIEAIAGLGVTPTRLSLRLDREGPFRFCGLPREWSGAVEAADGWSVTAVGEYAGAGDGEAVLMRAANEHAVLRLLPPVHLRGRLLAGGKPLVGRELDLLWTTSSGGGLAHATSDVEGRFAMTFGRGAPDRDACADLMVDAGQGDAMWQQVVVAPPGSDLVDLGAIELGRRLEVLVRTADEQPLAGAAVSIGIDTGSFVAATTDAAGRAVVECLPASARYLGVRARGHHSAVVPIPAAAQMTVQMQSGNGLAVAVLGPDARTAADVRLQVECDGNPFVAPFDVGAGSGPFHTVLSLDEHGIVSLSDLAPGKLLHCCVVDRLGSTLLSRDVVAPPEGRVDAVELRVAPGFEIAGRVSDDDGRAISRARVRAARGNDEVVVRTDADGNFHLGGLRAAAVAVRLEVEHPLFATWTRDDVTLAPGDGELQVRMQRGRRLRVRVLQTNGEPVQASACTIGFADGSTRVGTQPAPGRFVFDCLANGPGTLSLQLGGRHFPREVPALAEDLTWTLPDLGTVTVAWPAQPDLVCAGERLWLVVTSIDPGGETERHDCRRDATNGQSPLPLSMPLPAGRYRLQLEARRPGGRVAGRPIGAPREVDVAVGAWLEVKLP